MRIENAGIILSSDRSAVQQKTVKQSLRMWVNGQPEVNATEESTEAAATLDLSVQARQSAQWQQALSVKASSLKQAATAGRSLQQTGAASKTDTAVEDMATDPNLKVLMVLFQKMFGVKFYLIEDAIDCMEASNGETARNASANATAAEPAANQSEGWGLTYDRHEEYLDAETTSVNASGLIKTADGQEIQFQFNLTMSRQFMTENNLNIRMGDATRDPLVINFDGNAAELSDRTFFFDVDVDGQAEQIAALESTSGFLALDKNEDGVVNDGSELFGPASGNGFTDLRAYDEDKNNWIDEADSVFGKLRVWIKDAEGQESLYSLADKGIGALYLNPVSSEFSVKDDGNALQGQVRSSSIYVNETGTVGSMQQLDLVV